MKNDKPFDSNKSISIGDLTIENSEDKVIIYGDLEITRDKAGLNKFCLLYTSPSPRDKRQSRMPSSA